METTKVTLEVESNVNNVSQEFDNLNQSIQGSEASLDGLNSSAKTTGKSFDKMGTQGSKAMDKVMSKGEKIEGTLLAGVHATNAGAQAFTAYQGAIALAGVESEEFEKTMIKVQGAMALAQGIQGVMEAGKQFKQFGGVAVKALQGIKSGIMATGIGLLVVALGTIAAYWDDIKAAVGGVSKEQSKINEKAQKNVELEQQKLDDLGGQENILKMQGKTEKEILQIKIKQSDAAIKALEYSIEQSEITLQSQTETAKRNKEILKGILMFIQAPILLILKTIDSASEGLKALGVIKESTNLAEDLLDWEASLIFDPEDVKTKGQEAINEQKKTLEKLKNDKAGFQLSVKAMDEEANKTSTSSTQEKADHTLEIERQLIDMRLELKKDGYEKDRALMIEDYKRQREDILLNTEYTENQKTALLTQLKLNEANALEKLEQEEQLRLEEVRRKSFDLTAQTIADQTERLLAINKETYARLRADTLADVTLTGEEKAKLTAYYDEQELFQAKKIQMQARVDKLGEDQKYLQIKQMILEDELRAIKDNATKQKEIFNQLQVEKQNQAKLEMETALANVELTEAGKALIVEEYNNKIRDIEYETAEYTKGLDEQSAVKKKELLDASLEQVKQGMALLADITAFSAEQQTKSINKRYDSEIKKAEGNVALQNQLEQKRVAELNKANKKAFEMKKASDIASATIDGYRAVLSTFAQTPGGPILKGIAAGLAGTFAAMNIAKIASQKFEGASFTPQDVSGGGSNGSEAGAGGTITPTFNVVGDSGVNQLQQANQPLQAYVVSGDITTAQALDRERIETATL
jgi:hypothetical protein